MSKDSLLRNVDFGELFSVDSGDPLDAPIVDDGNLRGFSIDDIKIQDDDNDNSEHDSDDKDTVIDDTHQVDEKKKNKDSSSKSQQDVLDTNSNSDNNAQSFALVFANFISQRGVLSSFDENAFKKYIEENGEDEAIGYLYDSEVEFRASELKKMYAQDRQEILDYIEMKDNGVDPTTALDLSYTKSKFESIKESELDNNEELRKKVIKQDMKFNTNMSDDDIDEVIDSLINTGKDVTRAKKALTSVKKHISEQIKIENDNVIKAQKDQEEMIRKNNDSLKKSIYDTKEIFGQTINKQTQQKLEKFLLEPVANDSNGNPIDGITAWFIKNPLQAKINIAYAIMTGIMDGDLSKIEKKVKTSQISNLEKSFKNSNASLDGKSNTPADGDGSILSALKNTFKL